MAAPTFGMSFRFARLAGIELRVHVTTLIVFGWILFAYLGTDWVTAVEGALLVACTFTFIALHELGHALAARRFGIRTRDITLLPIGGVATLERMPERPREELLVALAGPAVNLVLAALLFAVLQLSALAFDPRVVSLVGGPFVARLLVINLSMALFNLIPAFPMDGGRVLRSLLALRRDHLVATVTAARVGQVVAAAMGIAGVFFSPSLVFVALFVWLGARAEVQAELARLARAQLAHPMQSSGA